MEVSVIDLGMSDRSFMSHPQVHVGPYTRGTIRCTIPRNVKFLLQYQIYWQLCFFPHLWQERGLPASGGKASTALALAHCVDPKILKDYIGRDSYHWPA
jgi:hypothetical protein